MRAGAGRIGIALGLGLGLAAGTAQAADATRDACFSAKSTPDQMITGCNYVLNRQKREDKTSIANAYFNRGLGYSNKGDYERAIADFTDAIRMDASDSRGFSERGLAYYNKEQYDAAIKDLDEAVRLDPKYTAPLVNRGLVFAAREEFDRAIGEYTAAIALEPGYALAYYNRGVTYESKGDLVRALADLNEAARLDPQNADVAPALERVRAAQAASKAASLLGGKPTGPATIADLRTQEQAVVEVWTRLPFTAEHAMFVNRKANAFGDYDARPSNAFAPGEKLLTYLEPAGYGWKPAGNDTYQFGVTVDFEVLSTDGKILGGQKGILKQDITSHYRNREFFINSTMTLDGITPGNYVLIYTIHDNTGDKTARVEQPFTIKN